MTTKSGRRIDNTLPLVWDGYAWLPERRRRAGGVFHTRVMGQRAVGLAGPEAVRFFYDERNVQRHTAVPEPVQGTLFGHGAVHTLDGADHRHRKAMFLSLTGPDGAASLVEYAGAAWDEAEAQWPSRERIVVFDEASRILTRGACDWAGVDVGVGEVPAVARDLVALVDGFATLGPRHWRARRARGRLESRFADLVRGVRAGGTVVPVGSAADVVARHVGPDGTLLEPRVAAVELLNVVRPTVAVCWFVAYAAHALHRWPNVRDRLRAGDAAYTEAFVHEVRRFYPFAPFIGGRAVRELTWPPTHGDRIPAGSLLLLDLYGQNHDTDLWKDPYTFRPERFLDRPVERDELVPQGGGDPAHGHRCPGEGITVGLLAAFAPRLARLHYRVPDQDMTISLRRIPARPRSGMVLGEVRRDSTRIGSVHSE